MLKLWPVLCGGLPLLTTVDNGTVTSLSTTVDTGMHPPATWPDFEILNLRWVCVCAFNYYFKIIKSNSAKVDGGGIPVSTVVDPGIPHQPTSPPAAWADFKNLKFEVGESLCIPLLH